MVNCKVFCGSVCVSVLYPGGATLPRPDCICHLGESLESKLLLCTGVCVCVCCVLVCLCVSFYPLGGVSNSQIRVRVCLASFSLWGCQPQYGLGLR